MKYARVVILMMIAALWPATAHAARGWWEWLEELSGPGHFDGPAFSYEVMCWKGKEAAPCGRWKRKDPSIERNVRLDRYVEVTAGALTSHDRPRFKDSSRRARIRTRITSPSGPSPSPRPSCSVRTARSTSGLERGCSCSAAQGSSRTRDSS